MLLRADNADERLSAIGHRLGLLSSEQLDRVRAKYEAIEADGAPARTGAHPAGSAREAGGGSRGAGRRGGRRIESGRERARVSRASGRLGGGARERGVEVELGLAEVQALEVRVRYRGYIERQQRTADRAATLEHVPLPAELWEQDLHGLSRESREKLGRWRPATVGQAGRIAGVSPSDVAVLMVHARRSSGRNSPKETLAPST